MQASRRLLDDDLTARLAIQNRAFSFRHSSLSSDSGSTSNSTYERIYPLCADYQEPSRLIRKLPEFANSTENLSKPHNAWLAQWKSHGSSCSVSSRQSPAPSARLLQQVVQMELHTMQRQTSSACRSPQTAASQLSTWVLSPALIRPWESFPERSSLSRRNLEKANLEK